MQEFVRRPIVAQDVGEKCLVKSLVDPFIPQQGLHIEEVPRMLTINGGDEFPRIEIGKRTTWISAKPNCSSTIGRTVLNSVGWTVPRSTGVTSILIWAFR